MESVLFFGTLAVAVGLGVLTIGVGRSVPVGRTRGDVVEAILQDSQDTQEAVMAQPLIMRLLGPAFDLFDRAVRAVTPGWWLDRIRHNAVKAGLGRWGVEGVLVLKAVTAIGSGAVLLLASAMVGRGPGAVMWAILGGLVGFFTPDLWIARRADARQDEIRRALPEALDLMAISVQSGMGLEQAMELVARRLPGALGDELHRMIKEVQLGTSRRDALDRLRERTDVSELSTFALSLAQADALGTPLGEVLRVQAQEIRMLRRQRAREQAAKVPVKLLFPLLFCIFPALGIVVIGPAVVSIMKVFGG